MKTMLIAAVAVGLAGAAWARSPAPLEAETLGVLALDPANSERVYVADIAINNILDGRVRVFDARRGRLLGMIATGYAGYFVPKPATQEVLVATTYYSRGGRGQRTDVLEVHDAHTLAFKHEIVLPPIRAQALNYRGLLSLTANGRFALVQNATPATSVTVVDLQSRTVAGEIANPGCWGTMPAQGHPQRFAMLCGDGKISTVTLNDQGQEADRQVSEQLFDADRDAWFLHTDHVGDRFWFVSFRGELTEMDLGGPVARRVAQRSLLQRGDAREGWRPGGYQSFAVHPNGRWLVVAMHRKGAEGSHKFPAEQIWLMDLNSGQRLARYPGKGAVSMVFSRSGQRLQALDGLTGAMHVWQVQRDGRLQHRLEVPAVGAAALQLESHD